MTITVTMGGTSTAPTFTSATTVMSDYLSTLVSSTTALIGTGAIIQKVGVGAAGFLWAKKKYTGKLL